MIRTVTYESKFNVGDEVWLASMPRLSYEKCNSCKGNAQILKDGVTYLCSICAGSGKRSVYRIIPVKLKIKEIKLRISKDKPEVSYVLESSDEFSLEEVLGIFETAKRGEVFSTKEEVLEWIYEKKFEI